MEEKRQTTGRFIPSTNCMVDQYYSGTDGDLSQPSKATGQTDCSPQRNRQSPITIIESQAQAVCLPDIAFDYEPNLAVTLTNIGHTFRIQAPSMGSIDVPVGSEVTRYWLSEVHFHRPSEHKFRLSQTDRDIRYAMEMHLVHRAPIATGKFEQSSVAVVGVWIDCKPGYPDQPEFAKVWKNLPVESNPTFVDGLNVDHLLPDLQSRSFYHYIGSLTTPPYTQDLLWYVLKAPVKLSPAQFEEYRRRFGMSARPPQRLCGRTVQNQTTRP
jgi:carbonic anhydrase